MLGWFHRSIVVLVSRAIADIFVFLISFFGTLEIYATIGEMFLYLEKELEDEKMQHSFYPPQLSRQYPSFSNHSRLEKWSTCLHDRGEAEVSEHIEGREDGCTENCRAEQLLYHDKFFQQVDDDLSRFPQAYVSLRFTFIKANSSSTLTTIRSTSKHIETSVRTGTLQTLHMKVDAPSRQH